MIERCDLVNCELRSDSGPEAGNLKPKFRARSPGPGGSGSRFQWSESRSLAA